MQIDFSSPFHFFWALLPEVVISTGAIVLLMFDAFTRGPDGRSRVRGLGWGALAVLALAAAANASLLRLEEAVPTGMIAIDGFRIFANFLFLAAGALTILVSLDYLEREGLWQGEFYVLLLFAVVGMMILAASRDIILIFLGFELMSFPAYVLAAFNRRDPKSAEAGLKYFLLGAFSSAFLLYGLALMYGASGTTNLALFRLATSATEIGLLTMAGIALVAIGFAFKVSAVPFHVWTPDAYEGAPTPVTAFLAAAIKAGAFAAFIRIFVLALGDLHPHWERIIWWLAVLTMIVPNLVALVQDNVKRLLAYSSVAHAGYLLVALVAANESGMASFLFYVIAYTAMIMGAFAIVLVLAGEGDRRHLIADYAGLGWRHPWTAAALSLFLVSLAGLPPTGGFVGKLYILRASVEAGYPNLAVVLAVTTLVSYWYYLRVIVTMYMKPAVAMPGPIVWGRPIRAALAVCALVTLYLGVLPSWPLLKAAESVRSTAGIAAERVLERVPVTFR